MENSELSRIRHLLLNLDEGELHKIKQLLNHPNDLALEISKVLPEAVLFSMHENEKLSTAFVPMIELIITRSVAQNPKLLADALYPIIGRSIRKSINEEFKKLLLTFNELIENTFSAQSFKWRYQALVTGRKYSEIVIFNTINYKAEHVFLIHRETGLLLCDIHDEMSRSADPDMVSSMLKAITDFVHDSFEDTAGNQLNLIELEEYQVLIEQGPHAIIASLVKGYTLETYRNILTDTLEKIHEEYHTSLLSFKGDTFIFEPCRVLLRKCLLTDKKKEFVKQKSVNKGLLFAIPIVLLLLFFIGRGLYFNNQWNNYIKTLKNNEQTLVSQYGKHKGNYFVKGLIMPGAIHPDTLFRSFKIKPNKLESQWLLYLPGNNDLLLSLFEKEVGPQPGLNIVTINNQIKLSGWVTPQWMNDFEVFVNENLSWLTIDQQELEVVNIEALNDRITGFNQRHLLFKSGQFTLTDESETLLKQYLADLELIQKQSSKLGKTLSLTVTGYADSLGDETFNKIISMRRAENVANRIVEHGFDNIVLKTEGKGVLNIENLSADERRRIDFNLTLN